MPLDEHQRDEHGDHDPSECEVCVERDESVPACCGCGNCCDGSLIVEVSLRDAQREPRIRECGPVIEEVDGNRVLVGYILNDRANEGACRFFDRESRECTIYETRPLCCRTFDCRGYQFAEPSWNWS